MTVSIYIPTTLHLHTHIRRHYRTNVIGHEVFRNALCVTARVWVYNKHHLFALHYIYNIQHNVVICMYSKLAWLGDVVRILYVHWVLPIFKNSFVKYLPKYCFYTQF